MFKGPVTLHAGRGKNQPSSSHPPPLPSYFSLIHILLTKHHSAIKRSQYSLERTKDRASSPHPHLVPPIGGRSCGSLLRLLKDGSRGRANPPQAPSQVLWMWPPLWLQSHPSGTVRALITHWAFQQSAGLSFRCTRRGESLFGKLQG